MKVRRLAIGAFLVVCLVCLTLLGVVYGFQRVLIYPGWSFGTAAVKPDMSGYRDVAVATADGSRGRLLYHRPQPGKPVILFFHGNGDSVSGSVVSVEAFVAAGYGAVLPEYRGFNGNPGRPSEQGLYVDARAARAWMAANGIGPDRTVVMGYSLGTGVAAQIAVEMQPRALVLVAPYSSLPHVIAARMPWMPVNLLVRDRFDTAAKIARISCPVLIVHGDADNTIPASESVILRTIRRDATRIVFRNMGHGVMFYAPAQNAIVAWLRAKVG